MNRLSYQTIDRLTGWVVFVIATLVYLLTLEPTASFWDCGEFIACGYKLMVGHPPGAPFFMLLVRLFSLFAPDVEHVGVLANAMSAFASGATIMFLYWTIAHFARRLILQKEERELSVWEKVSVVGASLIGALCYTFSDTFWFSAVEGEVYALSSLFTAVVFWAILKWESEALQPRADRWIVLIAYLMGLSIGVHLLNLLAIPAICLVYYFRKYQFSWLGLLKCLVLSGVLLLAVLYGVIQGLIVIASSFELLFVNAFGLPFMSGAIFFFLLLAGGLVFGVLLSHRRRAYTAHLLFVCFAMLLLGYSSYTLIVVRSLANPTLDQNGVDNMFALKSYLNREQYGDRPLITGPYYNAPVEDYVDGSEVYAPRGDRYEVVTKRTEPVYDRRFETIFPRMWSHDPVHVKGYRSWVDIKGTPIAVRDHQGREQVVMKPTFGENLLFFFNYQLGHMYWRYFMWNFSGRQNDFQGYGHDIFRGNWITGIPFLDEARLGPQDQIPAPYKDNWAHNRYFLLPLFLGVFGLFSQFSKDTKNWGVVLTLFVLTGIAIVVYLNQKPFEPRERDYSFAASFYAFAIWVGIGVVPLARVLSGFLKERMGTSLAIVLSFLGVPLLMGVQNWDDHDRSHRYVSVEFGRNLLRSVSPHGILFTYADNDTFPLWYAQEVEGFRSDARVCNLTYLSGDWYIDEMSRKAYDAEGLPFGLKREEYLEGKNDVVLVQDRLSTPVSLEAALQLVVSTDPRTKIQSPYAGVDQLSFFPSSKLWLKTDSTALAGYVSPHFLPYLYDTVYLEPGSSLIYKNGLAVYALLANNHWKRGLFYSPMLPKEMYWGLDKFFVKEGMVSGVEPVRQDSVMREMVDTAKMYRYLMNEYNFRSIADERVYLDETCKRMIEYYVDAFVAAADSFNALGNKKRAEEIVDRCFDVLPTSRVGWSYKWIPLIEAYYYAGATAKGDAKLLEYAQQCLSVLRFTRKLAPKPYQNSESEVSMNSAILQELIRIAQHLGSQELRRTLEAELGGVLNS